MILTSLLNAVSFAFRASAQVGVAYTINALIFIGAALFAPRSMTGTNLLSFLSIAQLTSALFLSVSLSMRIFRLPTGNIQRSKSFFAETREEVKTLFTYGTKQIVIVAVVAFSQWLIQRKIVLGSGGSAENAIYSVGNQVFNIVTFFPTLLGPVIVSRLAAAEADTGLRRRICIGSIKLFAAIALIACICTFFGLRVAVLFLPDRYTAAVVTGTLAAVAAAFQIIKAPFSLYFLSELRTSREIASAISGAVFMIAATSLFDQLHPNAGTIIRLLGCILQAALLALFFTIESRTRRA